MRQAPRNPEAGGALYFSLVVGVVLMGMSTVMVTVTTATTREHVSARAHDKRLYIAEAGVRRAVHDLGLGGSGSLGYAAQPIGFGQGSFHVTTVDDGDGTFTVTSTGRYEGRTRTIRAVVQEATSVFHHAVFAGNDSKDPSYQLEFGGSGVQADVINGDVYSGQDILVEDDAAVNGELRASGTIIGDTGKTGVTQPLPDINGMNYEVNHDVDFADQFDQYQTWKYDSAGGYAWQVSKYKESHIFRKNPSDRTTECGGTEKDDFFLEDPYQSVQPDYDQDGSNPYRITLTGGGKPGPDGNGKVYYIDGNLWLHNKKSYSLQLEYVDPGGTQVTFVVKGNIYVSDNLFVDKPSISGVALIAIKDSTVADSGNIYFGDPVFGTLQNMNAFMYAESDFYDNNLDAAGSAVVELNGIMSAGNQVNINRDFGTAHSKLTVNFDDRIKDGELDLPGLPTMTKGKVSYSVVAWREVSSLPQP